MEIIIEKTRSYSRTNKDQIGDSFRTDEKKGKHSSPRMVWFCDSRTVEILNVRWPFIHGNPNKDKLTDEINFKNCIRLRRKTESKFFAGIIYKKREFIIYPEYFDTNNIFSHPFIQNLKHKPNVV